LQSPDTATGELEQEEQLYDLAWISAAFRFEVPNGLSGVRMQIGWHTIGKCGQRARLAFIPAK
jgi:hypothetical protein